MRVCIIAEKSSLAFEVIPHVLDRHPDLDRQAFAYAQVNPYSHLNSKFRFPRGLGWRDYPFVGEPAYEPFGFHSHVRGGNRHVHVRLDPGIDCDPDGYRQWSQPVGTFPDTASEASRRFGQADLVLAFPDPDPASWLAMERALRHLAPPGGAEVLIPEISDLSREGITLAFDTAHAMDGPVFKRRTAAGRVSRRFDFCYRVNSMAIMDRTLAAAGAPPGTEVPSKYGLQTLYHLRRNGPMREQALSRAMDRWRGTGMYPGERPGLADIASRCTIIEMLVSSGLVNRHRPDVVISALGTRFLELLHPHCEDPDLVFRIETWKRLPEPEANDKVDRYVRTFFGKQIRYLARNGSVT